MTDLKSTIRIGADASGVDAGVTTAKRSLSSLGQAAADAGRKGGAGLDAIGKGGDAAAKKVEAATKNTIGSIQRQIAAFEAGGKSSREYQESLARMRGIDTNALKPYLDQLDAARIKAGQAANANTGLTSSLDRVGLSAAQVGTRIGLMVAAMVAGTGAAVKAAINTADEFAKMAQKTGVAVESLRELNYAASLSDVSTDALATGLKKLSQNMGKAADGSREQAAAFEAIGVSVKRMDGTLKGADTVVAEISEKFAGLKDSSEKTAIAVALFGKAGADMIPLLNSGAGGLRDMADEANELGIVFSGDLAKNAEKFNDNLTRIKTAAQGGAFAILDQLLPTLNTLAEKFVEASRKGGTFASDLGGWLDASLKAGSIWAYGMGKYAITVAQTMGGVAAAISRLAHLDFDGFKAISKAIKEDIDQALADVKNFARDVTAIVPTIGTTRSERDARDARRAGLGTAAIINATTDTGAASAARRAIADQNRELKEQAKLLAELAGLSGSFADDWGRLSALYKAGKIDLEGLTKAQADLLAKQPAIKAMADAEVKAAEAIAKANESARKEREKYISTLSQGVYKIQADVAVQIESNERLGLSKQAIVDLDAAKLELLATEVERSAALKLFATQDEQQYLILVKQAQAYRDLAKAKVEGASKAAAIEQATEASKLAEKAADDAEKAWQKTTDSINDSLTDALMRGFESGKDFAKNMRDTVVNMFKTLVLRPVVSAIVNPVAQATAGAFGLAGAANAASGASGLLGGASMLGSFGGALAGGAGWLTGATSLTGALSAGASLIGTGTTAGLASGVGMLAGALGPIALGIGALSALFGSNAPKVRSLGQADIFFDAQGNELSQRTQYKKAADATNSTAFVRSLQEQYQSTAAALGIGTVSAMFGFGANDKDGGQFAITGPGYYAENVATSEQAISDATQRVLYSALKQSDLPAYLSGAFDGIDAKTSSIDQIQAALDGAAALKTFYDQLKNSPFATLRDISDEAFTSLLHFSGGVGQLSANLDTYYEQFYSAEEKRQNAIDKIVAAVNASGGSIAAADFEAGGSLDTRPEYRALVESAGSGSALQAALLSLAGVFAEITPQVDDLSAAAARAAEDVRRAAERLAATNAGLQDKLDLLTGAQTERSIELRDATDESTKALLRQIYAQQDLAAATEAAARAAQDAAAAYARSQQDRLSGATDAASAAYDGLARAVDAQRAQDVAAYEAQKAIAKAAFTSQSELLQGQIDSAKTSLDDVGQSVGRLSSLSGALRSTLAGLRITGSEGQTRANAQAQISEALADARGGVLPLDGQLSGALNAISQPSEQLFSTFQDYARDFYKTANDISALGNISDAQLSEAEATQALLRSQVDSLTEQKRLLRDGFDEQVDALDSILENAQLQLDAANGINTGILSVADALATLNAAVGNLGAVRASQGLATTPGLADTRAGQIRDYVTAVMADTSLSEGGRAALAYAEAQRFGATEAEVSRALGVSPEEVRQYFGSRGVPRFATGTSYVNRDGLAYLHEGEAVVPKAYNPAAGGSGAIEALVATLTAEIRTLRASSERSAENTGRMANTLDGQQATPLLVEFAT